MTEPTVLLCDAQRFSVHDGAGVRTVLFLKGCPLRCVWCQNPETHRRDNELSFTAADCVACGDCATVCERDALAVRRSRLEVRWSRCDDCLACTHVCPSKALAPVAHAIDVDAAVRTAIRDREFFGDDGGVTLSGGEPFVHRSFLARLLPRLKEHGVHVAVETCGHWRWDVVSPLFEWVDLVLFDLKAATEESHRALTGVGHRVLMANLRRLVQSETAVRVRIPLVPPLNVSETTVGLWAETLSRVGCRSVELLPYHRLWESKLAKLRAGREPLGIAPPDASAVRRYADLIRRFGVEVRVETGIAG